MSGLISPLFVSDAQNPIGPVPGSGSGEFSGLMELGDAYAATGRVEDAISCYGSGLRVQVKALGDSDPRVANTYRYLAKAHIQAMQFEEAEEYCKKTLQVRRQLSAPASLEEADDRRLLALVCEAKGDYETALEHLTLASLAMLEAEGRVRDVAAIDAAIGNIYSSLSRFGEAVLYYHKALAVFESLESEDQPFAASVYVRLAELYYRTGQLRESKSYCENALRIYEKPLARIPSEEISRGLIEISVVYESINDHNEALRLLHRAVKLMGDNPVHRGTVAGLEAQMGVIFYVVGRFCDARDSFGNAIAKLRAIGERQSAFFGIVLNQMGLACVQLYRISEAAGFFEEAREIMELECGPCHLGTLGVYSNLAATYDAMGRVEDAIEILEYILKVREQKLGTVNPDVDDEKRRLAQLLREVGRSSRGQKPKSLKNLMNSDSLGKQKKEGRKGWSVFSFRN